MKADTANPTAEQKHKDKIEGYKLLYDLFKHATTLATGSLLLLSTLLEKFFKAPKLTWLIGLTFTALVVSLASSLFAMFSAATKVYTSGAETDDINKLESPRDSWRLVGLSQAGMAACSARCR